jgi:hypothetical protein
LYVTAALSPVPKANTSTAIIALPGTVLRNSQADAIASGQPSILFGMALHTTTAANTTPCIFQDITFDSWGSSGIFFSRGSQVFIRCVFDSTSYLNTTGNRGFFLVSLTQPRSGTFSTCSWWTYQADSVNTNTTTESLGVSDAVTCSLTSCYMRGGSLGPVFSRVATVRFTSSVFDSLGEGATSVGFRENHGMIVLDECGFALSKSTTLGKTNEFRSCSYTTVFGNQGVLEKPAVIYIRGSKLPRKAIHVGLGISAMTAIFKNNQMDCIRLGQYGSIEPDSGLFDGLRDGGGNLGVGIDIRGPFAFVAISPQSGTSPYGIVGIETNVSGACGDIRLGGLNGASSNDGTIAGTILTYQQVQDNKSIVELGYMNQICQPPSTGL